MQVVDEVEPTMELHLPTMQSLQVEDKKTPTAELHLPAAQSKVPWGVQYFPGGLLVPAKQSLMEVDPIEFVVTPIVEQ